MNIWLKKIKNSLSKTSNDFSLKLKKTFSFNKPNKEILDDIREVLILGDLGVKFSNQIVDELKLTNFEHKISKELVYKSIQNHIISILTPYTKQLSIPKRLTPYTIIFSGINGSGKTTTLAKVAYHLKKENKKVLIVSCDTFRASANEQVIVWARRSNCPIITGAKNSDPASIVYNAFIKAKKDNFDVLLIDTAGRMFNRIDLMNELKKINKVLSKIDATSPHLNLLVTDATIGQIAIKQVESFKNAININGVIVTKLDGTSKAGVIVPIIQEYKLPIYFIGIGEKIDDLSNFSPTVFSKKLLS